MKCEANKVITTFYKVLLYLGLKGDWYLRVFFILPGTLMELIFNPCSEFR